MLMSPHLNLQVELLGCLMHFQQYLSYIVAVSFIATEQWFSPVSSTNKTDHHDVTDILLKLAFNTINPNPNLQYFMQECGNLEFIKTIYFLVK